MQELNAATVKSVKSGAATQDREGAEAAEGGEHLPAAPGRTGGAAVRKDAENFSRLGAEEGKAAGQVQSWERLDQTMGLNFRTPKPFSGSLLSFNIKIGLTGGQELFHHLHLTRLEKVRWQL